VSDPYKVRLEIFEGPLDLLLYLVKKEEVDIFDINIERIAKSYLEYMDAFKLLNIDLASEFIVMAANLMYIKSRTLLPKVEQAATTEDEEDEDDPRWELIRQLIEYKKFKDAASFLQSRAQEQADIFPASPLTPPAPVQGNRLADASIFDLIRAFQKVVNSFGGPTMREIVDDHWTVSDKIHHLLNVMPHGTKVRLTELFEGAGSKDELIVTFIAMLELMKLRQIQCQQDHLLGEIFVWRNENA
jgi:segregation and condensation protein A